MHHALKAVNISCPSPVRSVLLRRISTTRHKSVDVLAAYVRRVDLFKEHPVGFRLPPSRHVTSSNGLKVTVLPPTLIPPESGGGGDPRRVYIEIVVHVPPPRRGPGVLTIVLLLNATTVVFG